MAVALQSRCGVSAKRGSRGAPRPNLSRVAALSLTRERVVDQREDNRRPTAVSQHPYLRHQYNARAGIRRPTPAHSPSDNSKGLPGQGLHITDVPVSSIALLGILLARPAVLLPMLGRALSGRPALPSDTILSLVALESAALYRCCRQGDAKPYTLIEGPQAWMTSTPLMSTSGSTS
jgi:hypothetical protein